MKEGIEVSKIKSGRYLYSHQAEISGPTFPAIRQTYFSRGAVGEFVFSRKFAANLSFRHGIDSIVFEMGNALSLDQIFASLANDEELRNNLQISSKKCAMQFSITVSVLKLSRLQN
jgi:hypothetical protein